MAQRESTYPAGQERDDATMVMTHRMRRRGERSWVITDFRGAELNPRRALSRRLRDQGATAVGRSKTRLVVDGAMAYAYVGVPKNIVRDRARRHPKKTSRNRLHAIEGVPLKYAPQISMVPDASPTRPKLNSVKA
jgi:hypothetical protein